MIIRAMGNQKMRKSNQFSGKGVETRPPHPHIHTPATETMSHAQQIEDRPAQSF